MIEIILAFSVWFALGWFAAQIVHWIERVGYKGKVMMKEEKTKGEVILSLLFIAGMMAIGYVIAKH